MCDLTSNYQDGSYDVISRHESAAAWRVNTKHLPAYAEAPASFWSIFNFTFSHSLEFSDQNIKIRQFLQRVSIALAMQSAVLAMIDSVWPSDRPSQSGIMPKPL